MSRTAIAAVTPEDGFSIGTYLASASTNQQPSLQQTGVLNDILSVLGPNASVTAVGYQGLANTYVSVSQLIAASGGVLTTSNVLTAQPAAGDRGTPSSTPRWATRRARSTAAPRPRRPPARPTAP